MGRERAGDCGTANRERGGSESFKRITYLGKTAVYALFVRRAIYCRLGFFKKTFKKKLGSWVAGVAHGDTEGFGKDPTDHQSLIRKDEKLISW